MGSTWEDIVKHVSQGACSDFTKMHSTGVCRMHCDWTRLGCSLQVSGLCIDSFKDRTPQRTHAGAMAYEFVEPCTQRKVAVRD